MVFQQGKQWLIDPYSAEVREMSLVGLLERENVLQGKVFENGYAILTSYPRFLFVRNCEQPQCV